MAASSGTLGVFWAVLERFGRVEGVLLACLGASVCVLEASWGLLGRSWGGFWDPRRRPGSILGAFSKDFMATSAICENIEKTCKNNAFSLIFKVPGRFGGSQNREKSIK